VSGTIHFVLFDVGGTLIRPSPSLGAIYARVIGEHGLVVEPPSIEVSFRRRWPAHVARRGMHALALGADEITTRGWWREIVLEVLGDLDFPGDPEPCFDALYRAFEGPEAWHVFEDVGPTLAALADRGVPVGILSNWDYRLERLLTVLGIAHHFSPIVVSALEQVHKPDPAIFERALARLGRPAGEVLYVGDQHALDVEPAERVGLRALRIDRRPDAAEAAGVIRRLTTVLDHLD
jgi:REG-2-like HAD superfamily hydrolase